MIIRALMLDLSHKSQGPGESGLKADVIPRIMIEMLAGPSLPLCGSGIPELVGLKASAVTRQLDLKFQALTGNTKEHKELKTRRRNCYCSPDCSHASDSETKYADGLAPARRPRSQSKLSSIAATQQVAGLGLCVHR